MFIKSWILISWYCKSFKKKKRKTGSIKLWQWILSLFFICSQGSGVDIGSKRAYLEKYGLNVILSSHVKLSASLPGSRAQKYLLICLSSLESPVIRQNAYFPPPPKCWDACLAVIFLPSRKLHFGDGSYNFIMHTVFKRLLVSLNSWKRHLKLCCTQS